MNIVCRTAISLLLRYFTRNPLAKLPALFRLAERLDKGQLYEAQIRTLRALMSDERGVWYRFTDDLFKNMNRRCLRRLTESFLLNASLSGGAAAREAERRYGCRIPWAILMDPTSACNLSCVGCWAAQYGSKSSLSYELMDSICRQGKRLGVHFYLFSGGEPLVRKTDLLRLCRAHRDCYFLSFTNGTLADDAFCDELARVGNLTLAFSIEGDEASTDLRRGPGTYRAVIAAMDRMRARGLLFGYSACYHSRNTDNVGSDAFVDDMLARGCRFAWYFTYIPVVRDAAAELLATPEQRAFMYRRVREIRRTKPLFALDFWNDGEFTQGCIAGGRRYLHINAAGDVEPCAFIHYANLNIRDVTLLEALRSPIFEAYRARQPFDENYLRPCPLLDKPDQLCEIVEESRAYSTEREAPEDVRALCAKTAGAAEKWAPVAGELWTMRQEEKTGDGVGGASRRGALKRVSV